MEQQILLIEDDNALGRGVAVALTESGRIVALARDLQQARQRWEQQSFDLVVLDLNLPDGNGLDFLRWLRQRSEVPVLILTANDLESDEVAGLTLGADDYVTKPFSPAELTARVDALLRRAGDAPLVSASVGEISQPPFLLNMTDRVVEKNGKRLKLTQLEYQIMKLFMENPDKALTREEILDTVWGRGYFGEVKIVDVNIRRLRLKIEDDAQEPRYIATVWGTGYKWSTD